ncbi:hypothetical protein TcWFU_007867 [Taenia crassiceps]|uniref:Uncharacterized protein n=1 Tax=Taenia crassiceps TaxID=6207 RepID=A0ABR4QBR9_9CEST
MNPLVDLHHRGLPVNPLILLPSGWVFNAQWESLCLSEEALLDLLDNQCFSAALQFAINHPSPPLSDSLRQPRAVSWFNLEVNPALKNDVVAVVIPIVGWKRTYILQLNEKCEFSVPLVNFSQCDSHVPSALPPPPPPPPPSPPLPPSSAKSTTAPAIQLPRRRANVSQSLSQNRNAFSPPAALSTTAPPTSLTLATHHTERCIFQSSNWLFLSGPYGSLQLCQNSLREAVVGFLGLKTESTREMAFLLKDSFGMRVIYHQRHPLSGIEGIDFDSNMPNFLQTSDVVIIMDDCSDRRASLSKALRSRSPIRQKSTKRSRFSLQEEDFRYFKPTGILISTSPVENFSFSALAMALRNQTLSGAAFTIPMDGSLSSEELQSLHHMKNVIAVPPPSTAGFAPKLLRRQLAGLVLQTISEGLGLPFLGSPELTPPVEPSERHIMEASQPLRDDELDLQVLESLVGRPSWMQPSKSCALALQQAAWKLEAEFPDRMAFALNGGTFSRINFRLRHFNLGPLTFADLNPPSRSQRADRSWRREGNPQFGSIC